MGKRLGVVFLCWRKVRLGLLVGGSVWNTGRLSRFCGLAGSEGKARGAIEYLEQDRKCT